jgi:hypothetical protein
VSGRATTKYSLPSEEENGQKPFEHTEGVGALPGRKNEPGVATLPDENLRGATFATSAGVGTHRQTFDPVSMPSQDDTFNDERHMIHGREHTGGVGRLPGRSDEEGVAVLPDERTSAGSGAGGVAGALGGAFGFCSPLSRLTALSRCYPCICSIGCRYSRWSTSGS